MVRIHFLNVGHGDCTIIEHASGRITMIDINQSSDWDSDTDRELLEAFPESYDLIKALQGAGNFGLGAFNNPQPAPGYGLADVLAGHNRPRGLLEELLAPQQPAVGLGALMRAMRSRREILEERGYKIGLTDPVEYFFRNFPGKSIFRYVQTHPDLDHMRGLHRLRLAGIHIANFWDTDHQKTIDEFHRDGDEDSWREYHGHRASRHGARHFMLARGASNRFYNQGDGIADLGDGLHVLAPTPELVQHANAREDWNSHSYVLCLIYGNQKVIFGGDATSVVWEDIHGHYGENLSCLVLKAAHHGRESGYYQPAVEAMAPALTVVSVGKKPDTDATNRYRNYSQNVLSTRWCGNIVVAINVDGTASFNSEYARN